MSRTISAADLCWPADAGWLEAGKFLDALAFFPVHSTLVRRTMSFLVLVSVSAPILFPILVLIRFERTITFMKKSSCLECAREAAQLLAGAIVDSYGPEHGGNAAGKARGK